MNSEAKTGRLRESSAFITDIGGAIRSHVGAVATNATGRESTLTAEKLSALDVTEAILQKSQMRYII